jgi:hypothetical protein
MAGRLDSSRHAPPVRLWRTNARVIQTGTQTNVLQTNRGAGDYGQKEQRFASVPIRIRIYAGGGPTAAGGAKPIGFTRRKRGYPPVVNLPTAS